MRRVVRGNRRHAYCFVCPELTGLFPSASSRSPAQGPGALLSRRARQAFFMVQFGYPPETSGAKLDRPELFRLLADAHEGDTLLVEHVDRLSRLKEEDWERLKVELAARKVRVVALDLPTSWTMATGKVDEFTARMFGAINGMMLDMLAAVARKDYEDRLRRQMQGQAKAKAEGKYVGRPENTRRNGRIAAMLAAGTSYSATGCSRATIAKIARRAQAA